ncbi:MAG TPA: hypothetical protein VIP82_13965 [Microbacterium sp.]|uniref:hypothetical protein n=1 Tax=Microbacterium sp. TaxID=51671 RepID=UPI002F94FF34
MSDVDLPLDTMDLTFHLIHPWDAARRARLADSSDGSHTTVLLDNVQIMGHKDARITAVCASRNPGRTSAEVHRRFGVAA